jgi:chromosome segregation ATPase
MRIIFLLAGVLAMANVALAGVYEWTDSQGGVHFTDNADNIPAKYRNKAREKELQPAIEIKSEPAQAVTTAEKNSPPTYGGHDETWWRASYSGLREEMKNIQDNIPEKRAKFTALRRQREIYQKTSGRIAYYDMLKEIERDEARVKELQKELADLDDKAAKAGVPLAWRQ